MVDAHGQPVLGRYVGVAERFNWEQLAAPHARSRWWRQFHHKRWHYVVLACGEVFAAVAIVDLGWTSTAFAYAFDRRARRMLASVSRDGLPGIGAQVGSCAAGESRFAVPGLRIALAGGGVTLDCAALRIDARFGAGAPMLLAAGVVAGGAVHATQKSGGMPLAGSLEVNGRRLALDDGVASIDYSNGLLARATAWRWASAHSRRLGFNLQQGYFGSQENALWLDGQLIALEAAQFSFDPASPLSPWQVRTADGLLDLQFTPEGMRAQRRNLLLAASRYVQPIGTFGGTVRASLDSPPIPVVKLLGVTEDHFSRW